jgi:hypothetical protein
MDQESNLEQAGSLWRQISKKGRTYYSGYLGIGPDRKRIMLFVNPNKRPDKQDPDANLFIVNEIEMETANQGDLF